MNRRALSFIHESLQLAKIAQPEQKIKLLKMVKECYRQLKSKNPETRVSIDETILSSKTTDPDYINEK
jgi:hypothetical protein